MLTFSLNGSLGDILFSLYICKELSELKGEKQFNYHIQIQSDVQNTLIGERRIGFSIQDVYFILPLLQKQNYINEITFDKSIPNDCIDLKKFRDLDLMVLNIFAGDIRGYFYNLIDEHLPREFWKPIISVEPNFKFKDKILFTHTKRWINLKLDYKLLNPYKDHLVFIGLKQEYQEFKQKYFDLQYIKVDNMLEAAQYIAGAKGFIGNQSGLYTIAECLKSPRILLSPQIINFDGTTILGPFNNNPIGGWNEVAGINTKMISSLENLINKTN